MKLRNLAAFGHDIAAAVLAWLIAYLLRFNLSVPEPHRTAMFTHLLWVLPLQALILHRVQLYAGLWRYASLSDLRRITVAAALGAVAIATCIVILQVRLIPRSVLLLYPILLAVFMGGSRFAYRLWKEGRLTRPDRLELKRTLILGAGDVGIALARALARSPEMHVIGFLDDDRRKVGQTIDGLPVLGTFADLASANEALFIQQAIIALPGGTHRDRRRAYEICAAAKVPALAVPAIEDLATGRVQISQLRKIELDDLLGRDPVELDDQGLDQWIRGRVILVTGAGGSIGSDLCRQIARYQPRLLVLLEASEFALYRIQEEFGRRFPQVATLPLIGDVKDAARIRAVLGRTRPHVVFHAAAYKHVPLMENDNAWEAVRNNVLGTYTVAHLAAEAGTEEFVLVSTDKAVNPTNVMGATKRVAELVCQGLRSTTNMKLVTVRFGNVLGSTGSVVPKFREQIAAGGPITVTHPDVTRYFMLIPEAAQLVLQAGLMGKGGEIFVLDMGEPIRIVDLARDMIRLSGLGPDDIRIEFTGLRPGEKLYEEVLADDEETLPTPHRKLRVARTSAAVSERWMRETVAWLTADTQRSDDEVRAKLRAWLPEYVPTDATGPSSLPPVERTAATSA